MFRILMAFCSNCGDSIDCFLFCIENYRAVFTCVILVVAGFCAGCFFCSLFHILVAFCGNCHCVESCFLRAIFITEVLFTSRAVPVFDVAGILASGLLCNLVCCAVAVSRDRGNSLDFVLFCIENLRAVFTSVVLCIARTGAACNVFRMFHILVAVCRNCGNGIDCFLIRIENCRAVFACVVLFVAGFRAGCRNCRVFYVLVTVCNDCNLIQSDFRCAICIGEVLLATRAIPILVVACVRACCVFCFHVRCAVALGCYFRNDVDSVFVGVKQLIATGTRVVEGMSLFRTRCFFCRHFDIFVIVSVACNNAKRTQNQNHYK